MQSLHPALAVMLVGVLAPHAANPAHAGAACQADLDRDGLVGSADLNILLAAFGSTQSGDIDGSGGTDSTDLNLLLAAFGVTGCQPGPGPCCSANAAPGCDDPVCAGAVCDIEPACCDAAWDDLCALLAALWCEPCGPPAFDGDCCEPNGAPGCGDLACVQTVCTASPFCCDTLWDGACAAAAQDACDACNLGECCLPHDSPGCSNPVCEAGVCAVDPACCEVEWDLQCAYAADKICPFFCDGTYIGPCCEANPTPGCDLPDCVKEVCLDDVFCCDVEWDQICADDALDFYECGCWP